MDLYFKIKRENLLKLKHSNNELYKIIMTHIDEDKNKDVEINNKNEACFGRESYFNIKELDKYNHLKNINDGLDETQIIFDKALIKYLSINKIDIVKNNDINNLFIKRTHFDIYCIRLILEVMPELANQISKELCIDKGQLLLFAHQTPISRFIVYKSLLALNSKENKEISINNKGDRPEFNLNITKDVNNFHKNGGVLIVDDPICKVTKEDEDEAYLTRTAFKDYFSALKDHKPAQISVGFDVSKALLNPKHYPLLKLLKENPNAKIRIPCTNEESMTLQPLLFEIGCKWAGLQNKQNHSIRVNFYCLDIGYHNPMELTYTPNKNVLENEYIYDLKTEKFI